MAFATLCVCIFMYLNTKDIDTILNEFTEADLF